MVENGGPAEPDCVVEFVDLTFKVAFHKKCVVTHVTGKQHEIIFRCINGVDEVIALGPLHFGDDRVDPDKSREVVKKWIERRSLLSAALAFLDAEFALALPDYLAQVS